MTVKIGLTGSIGMGKSTTAALFADEGCAVWDADAAVHRLYTDGGLAVTPMSAEFPDAIVEGTVSRQVLRDIIAQDPGALTRIEAIVHPLVAQDRADFVDAHRGRILVFDVPLLFETGGDAAMDFTACVSVAPDMQRERVLARGTMSDADLARILSRQMPMDEKRRRADYVIETDTLEHARQQVQAVLADIKRRTADA